jgi:hypothetical protein
VNKRLLTRTDLPSGRWLRRMLPQIPLLILMGMILLFFQRMAFSDLILARGDTFLYFYPYWQAAAEALRAGRIPLWNPHLFMGAPLLANSQMGFFYPLNWPLWWWLPIPYAVSASILLHLFIAGWGTYLAGRRALALGRSAALLAALLFGLGGYLTAQVEHINQLQGLAWLPWFLVTLDSCGRIGHRLTRIGWATLAFALLFTLQFLAGHTQTSFITGFCLLIWSLAQLATRRLTANQAQALRFSFYNQRFRSRAPVALILGGILALLLAAVQLLPTFELLQLSGRQGGLPANEVLSFSLHPLLLVRALLPHYGQSMFTEYLAALPVTALMLAVIGGWQWRRWPGILPALTLVVTGLLLALGAYNPVNWLLARLPGFNLFRVPARWLVLYALGISLLAGFGWQVVLDHWRLRSRGWADVPARAREYLWHLERPLRLALLSVLGLMAWGVIANILAVFIPTGPEAPYEAPMPWSPLAWIAELLLVYLLLSGQRIRVRFGARDWISVERRRSPAAPLPLLLVVVLVLFLASRQYPYRNLTTPEAYFDLRPALARLLALTGCNGLHAADCTRQPDRFLSLSGILFDPGDQDELNAIYADQLTPASMYDYIIAVKQKEIVAPNLPLTYGLASVDGFDGGILPLRTYNQLMQLILPEGVENNDGRLREQLTAVPAARWLDLFNARYLITDKVGDAWHEGVYFDLQHAVDLADGQKVSIGYIPSFEATEIWMLASSSPGPVELEDSQGQIWSIPAEPLATELYRFTFPQPTEPHTITFAGCPRPDQSAGDSPTCLLTGATLVDTRDDTFQTLTLGNYRLIHSGDVKIYENLDVLPRAFLVPSWQWYDENYLALAEMSQPEFDVRSQAVLLRPSPDQAAPPSTGVSSSATIEFQTYLPERLSLNIRTESGGLLLLTDAFYPGWQARLDGKLTPIYLADGMFRGVILPAGQHQLQFIFQPQSFKSGRLISLVGLSLALGLALYLVRRRT